MAENRITSYEGMYDEDMNRDFYLVNKVEITEEQYTAIKEGYGVTGPDFQIVTDGTDYYLRGDQDMDAVKAIVDSYLVDKGEDPVFASESNDGQE